MTRYFTILFLIFPLMTYAIEPIKSMPCATEKELHAFNARVLQNELMVAALSCNHKAQYNEFLKKFGGVLSIEMKVIDTYFVRLKKDKSQAALTDFDTQLSNKLFEYSLYRPVANYCDLSKRSFEQVLLMKPADFQKIINNYSRQDVHGIKICGTK